jgi:ribosomal protein L11 methyltransferase
MEKYIKIAIQAEPALHEMLIAELEALDFDSFQELDDELEAYILEQHFNEKSLKSLLKKYSIDDRFRTEVIPPMNWNEQWEKNFQPVYVNKEVQIRASFHASQPQFTYDIVINPKMSFGTGHHETTHLIIEMQLELDHLGKDILDLGTGTGILAIMAHKLGAKSITATDIDEWSIENCKENFELNGVKNYRILQGTVDKLTLDGKYSIILANINKNVLLAELSYYSELLLKNGTLILSGFYETDIADIADRASMYSLEIKHKKTMNHWAALQLQHS